MENLNWGSTFTIMTYMLRMPIDCAAYSVSYITNSTNRLSLSIATHPSLHALHTALNLISYAFAQHIPWQMAFQHYYIHFVMLKARALLPRNLVKILKYVSNCRNEDE